MRHRTRTPVVATALLGALALSACNLKDDGKQAATPAPSTSSSTGAAPTPDATGTARSTASATSGTPTGRTPGNAATGTAQPKNGPHTLVSAAQVAGYAKLTGPRAPSDVPVDPGDVGPNQNLVVDAYGKTPSGTREVLLEGVDGEQGMNGKRMEHMIRGMIDLANMDGSVPEGVTMTDYSAGPLGGTLQCMPAQDAYPAAICAWADKDTTVVAYFADLSANDAAKKLVEMRAVLEK